MKVRELVARGLRENGYDGLYDGACYCEIADLMPCDDSLDRCSAGYKVPCDCKENGISLLPGEEHDFHIQAEKP